MKIYNVGSRIMNTYIYPIESGYVMIHTGYEHSFKNVRKRCRKQGIQMSEIKYVFLTHAHDDHAGFLNELLSHFPNIKVIISPKALPTLLKGQNSFLGGCSSLSALNFCRIMKLLGKGKHLFPAIDERYLDQFIRISPQNISTIEKELKGKILFTPGHTSDSISLRIGKIIFCGDAAMNGFPSQRRITIWIENKYDFKNSWDVLLADKANFLFPAHGKPFKKDDLAKYRNFISRIKLYPLK